jgi:hypothetical protein
MEAAAADEEAGAMDASRGAPDAAPGVDARVDADGGILEVDGESTDGAADQ